MNNMYYKNQKKDVIKCIIQTAQTIQTKANADVTADRTAIQTAAPSTIHHAAAILLTVLTVLTVLTAPIAVIALTVLTAAVITKTAAQTQVLPLEAPQQGRLVPLLLLPIPVQTATRF